MKNEKRDKAREQNGSLDGQYRFKALWRMAALINLGGMPLGNAAGPLVLWLMENDADVAERERKKRERD